MGRKILFITTDQMRFDAIGANGQKHAKTPAIDALAIDTLKQPLAQPPQAQPLYESPEPIVSALASALPTPQLTPQQEHARACAIGLSLGWVSHGRGGATALAEPCSTI